MGVDQIRLANDWVQRQCPSNILKNLRGSIQGEEFINSLSKYKPLK
jgi:hypothetical protein